ncbi:putative esterase D [Blyttiomyces helicus]|uniref:S-formylglutathione hydrolase n=1 Tax=Blyttiomyces helicus TaxID=388810 RepID=A0A4P9WI42_9FUNG|nr:putative esterase D [Blyttiomyces helicus]|eukprot:RKO92072.1 putative esterase D [Blyttiomyces helicus]
MAEFTELSRSKSHGGSVVKYRHNSDVLGCAMQFSAFLPPAPGPRPVLFWLSGLTCTEDNFIQKAGALKKAAELGLLLVCPDTSPRGLGIEGEDESWDFGTGAGFYLDATAEKWKRYRMFSYITKELPELVRTHFPVDPARASISGHSMGGLGSLVCALRNPGMFRSISAFAPISNPIQCPWGVKAFTGYLGDNKAAWKDWDPSELAAKYEGPPISILVDQGSEDSFLHQKQLLPEALETAVAGNDRLNLQLRIQDGYDHSYFFIQTFIDGHLEFHARALST